MRHNRLAILLAAALAAGASAGIGALTLQNGKNSNTLLGGAIDDRGSLTLIQSVLSHNVAGAMRASPCAGQCSVCDYRPVMIARRLGAANVGVPGPGIGVKFPIVLGGAGTHMINQQMI